MAFTCGFFNSVAHDRKYDAVQHGMIFDGIITDGIYATYLKAMVVKASENASEVIVQPGRAWFNHTWSYNDSDYPVAAPEPEVVLDRIDTLVLDVNSEDAVRNNQFLWVQGTPTSQTPEPPTLIHTATHNQYPLCDVYRQAGTTMIYAADITNRVGTSDCPFVTGVLESIDIDDLLAQWDDEFHTWENATKASFEGWMLNQQSVYTAWFNALKTQMAGDVADVEAWVQTIKDIIDEETATHLQLEIDEINSMLPSGSHITVTTSDTELYSRTVTITDEDNNTVTSQFDANGVAVFKSVPYVGSLTITSTDGVRTATEVVSTPYFARYEFTLAFWSATVNIIGDSVFGGDTVTITDSTTALVGTVVLNASGTGVFNATYPDTYKFSVTHGGETMEVSLAVTQETTYNVEIHSGLNYQAWLNAGRVSKSFSSLDDVLADEKTLRQLFLVHDAVDYVASQRVNNDLTKIFNTDLAAKWINNSDYALDKFYAVADIKTVMDAADKYGYGEWCLMPQVPTMTSNTAPSGEVSASSIYNSSYPAYKAFDGVTDTDNDAWMSSGSAPQTLDYEFTTPIKVDKFKLYARAIDDATTSGVNAFKIQGSNDGGTTWIDLYSGTYPNNISQTPYIEDNLTTIGNYKKYRLNVLTSHAARVGVRSLQFYTWAPKGNVPVMTANTAPYGEASASGQYSSDYAPYKAFNGVNSFITDCWISAQNSIANAYLSYTSPNPICVKAIKLKNRNATTVGAIKNFKLQGSNDGSNWTDISTLQNPNSGQAESAVLSVTNGDYYLKHRILVIDAHTEGSSDYVAVGSLQFYGRELKVSVPTMTSNTAPFGEVIESGEYSGYPAYLAFNGTNSGQNDSWIAQPIVDSWIGYHFASEVVIKAFSIQNRNYGADANGRIHTFQLQISDDGTVWKNVDNVIDRGTNANAANYLTFHNCSDARGKYVRILVKSDFSPYNLTGAGEIQFYGKDYSEKEFEVGTTKKWLYDHGVELETLSKYKGSSTTSAIAYVDNDEMYFPSMVGANNNRTNFNCCGLTIDLSPYSLIRTKLGTRQNWSGAQTGCTSICVYATPPSSGSYGDSVADKNIISPPIVSPNNDMCMDVSAINQNKFICVGTFYQNNREGSITEFWLE